MRVSFLRVNRPFVFSCFISWILTGYYCFSYPKNYYDSHMENYPKHSNAVSSGTLDIVYHVCVLYRCAKREAKCGEREKA